MAGTSAKAAVASAKSAAAAPPSAGTQEASAATSIPVQQVPPQPVAAESKPRAATPKPASSKLKSTVKIPGSLQSARKQAAQQPVQGQQEVKEEEEGVHFTQLPDKAYTEEEFMAAWQAYGQQVKAAGRQGEYIVLKEAPELGENHLVRVRITNTFQQDFFEKAKPGALNYLRKTLQNSQISMDCVIVKEEEGKRLYTAQEKFGYLLKKYPQLQDLKDRLGLEADF